MKYTIRHGSIAAIQHVTLPNGDVWDITDSPKDPDKWKLPVEVQATINRQFGTIFALPYGSRQGFIDNSIPIDVEVTE